jgi:hypothetical protein
LPTAAHQPASRSGCQLLLTSLHRALVANCCSPVCIVLWLPTAAHQSASRSGCQLPKT